MKVYDSQGRLKVVGFTGPTGPPGTQSVTCAELSDTASVLAAAIDVVSNGLSALIVDHNILSNRVSVNSATGGGGSVTSAEVQVASAAATSADAHANAASAAATSVDARIASLSAFLASISARSVGVSAKGLQSAIDAVSNTISNELSARAASVQTASAAATSADAHANTVSARVVSVSAELASLVQIASAAAASADAHANAASAAATSADAHANTASAAATSVDGRIASLSAFLASLSVRSVGNVSTHGLQSVLDALSNRISATTGGTGSVTSTELSIAVEGLKFLNLTNEDNADVSAGGPVFLAASAASAFHLATNVGNPGDQDAVGLATSLIAQTATGVVQTRGILSLTSAQWDDVTGQTGGLTIGSKYYVGAAGELTVTPPLPPAFIHPVGVAIAATKMWINPSLVDDFGPYLSAISARSTDGSSVKGVQNAVNALSAKIDFVSNAASIADVHASIASAAATSVNAHVNTVSARVVSVSAELVSLVQIASAAATSADNHANTVSAQAEGGFLSLQNIDTVSLVFGQPVYLGGSANTMLRAGLATFTGSAIQVIGLVADTVIAVSAVGRVQTRGRMDFTSAQVRAVAGLSSFTIGGFYHLAGTGTIDNNPGLGFAPFGLAKVGVAIAARSLMIDKVIPADQNLSSKIAALSSQVSVLSIAHTSINSVLSNVSARSVGDVSTRGLQSAIDALSNRLSGVVGGTGSVTSQEVSVLVQAASAAATSADGHANTVSARAVSISAELASLINIVSARAVSISAELASLLASTSAALRADITSVSAVIKADIASVSAAIMADAASHLASTSATIKADINSVSAAIMADAASHLASASAAIMVDVASHLTSTVAAIRADSTVGSIAALSNAISNDASVSAAIINEVSVQFGRGQFKMITTGAQGINTGTFTKVSGLSLSIVGSGFYEIHGQIVWSHSSPTSASTVFQFGMSMTAQPVMAMFRMMGNAGNLLASASIVASVLPFQVQFGGASGICATPSILYSAKPNPGASGCVANTMFFDGVLQASTAGSQLKVVVATSSGNFGVAIQPGSYIRAFRVG